MQARWFFAHGFSATLHVTLLGWLAGGAAWTEPARTPGQREIRVAWTVESAAAPPTTISPQAVEIAPVEADSPADDAQQQAERPEERLPLAETAAQRAVRRGEPVDSPRDETPPVRRQPAPTPALASAASLPANLGQLRPARPISNPQPTYPAAALAARRQGDVILKVTIAATGKVEQVELHRSSGHSSLDQSALDAVARWRFEPAHRNGRPVRWTVKLPIEFRLK